jgi:dipeptidyl aminopeptidase/acylaminoacyl peptidase
MLRGAVSRVGGDGWIPLVPPTEVGSSLLCYSGDSRLVALPRVPRGEKGFKWDESRVVVVDLASLTPIAELAAGGQVLRLAFLPDDRRLVVVGLNEMVVWDLPSGKPVRRFRTDGAIGSSNTIAFTPDGRRLITGHDDCTALVWDLTSTRQPAPAPLTPADLARVWDALAAADAAKGAAAVWDLVDRPVQAVAFLRERLKPAKSTDASTVWRLVTDLDAPTFARREAAGKELLALGEGAIPHLRVILKGGMTAESRDRVERLLPDIENETKLTGNRLRQVRAVAVLERVATVEARKLLDELAGGLAAARLTKEAAEAVERWRR